MGHGKHLEEMRKACRISVGNPQRRSLGIPGCRRENNIKIDLREIGCEGVDLIRLAEYSTQWRAVVNSVMNFPVR